MENNSDLKSLRTVFIGTNIIFWILAIFMINIMLMMNRQLTSLNRTVQSVMHVAGNPNLDGYEIVAGDDEEKVIYKFRRMMMPEEEMMLDENGMPIDPAALPDGEAPAVPAPAAE